MSTAPYIRGHQGVPFGMRRFMDRRYNPFTGSLKTGGVSAVVAAAFGMHSDEIAAALLAAGEGNRPGWLRDGRKVQRPATSDPESVCSLWCGVVWCGVVWCGVVWCGVVWCGVVWCGVVWCACVSRQPCSHEFVAVAVYFRMGR